MRIRFFYFEFNNNLLPASLMPTLNVSKIPIIIIRGLQKQNLTYLDSELRIVTKS